MPSIQGSHHSQFAFSYLNLRFNPFGELNRSQRAMLAILDLGVLPQRLQQSNTAIQLIADHGRGKSTHLLALHAKLSAYSNVTVGGYIQIHSGDKPKFCHQDIQFVDSVENLSKFRRSRLYKRSRSIALTCHSDLGRELKKAGYTVYTKRISLQCADQLLSIFNRRIAFAQRDSAQAIPQLTKSTVEGLIHRFGDNIRFMENQLYEDFQALKVIKNV